MGGGMGSGMGNNAFRQFMAGGSEGAGGGGEPPPSTGSKVSKLLRVGRKGIGAGGGEPGEGGGGGDGGTGGDGETAEEVKPKMRKVKKVGDWGAFEKHGKGFASKYMAKFGFKGRLGKNETGVVNPIQVMVRKDKAGLGSVKEEKSLNAHIAKD